MHLPSALVCSIMLSGCVIGVTGYESPGAPGILVITAEHAATHGLSGEPMVLEFGAGTNGTELVLRFLREAEASGGRYVSDIHIELLAGAGDDQVRCTTAVVPVGTTQVVPATQVAPGTGTTRSRQVMRPVSRMVTEYQHRCRMVSRPYTTTETSYSSRYDARTGSTHSSPQTRMVTRHRMENECRTEPVTRMVTRMEYQLESEYVPPRWETIQQVHTSWKLEERPPVCEPAPAIDEAAGASHRIRGIIYRAGRARPLPPSARSHGG